MTVIGPSASTAYFSLPRARGGVAEANRNRSAPATAVDDLHVAFPGPAGDVPVVRGVSFSVGPGEVLGIAGESGSGKSVTALAVMGLLPAAARVAGSVTFAGRGLLGLPERELRAYRGRRIALVPQDPMSCLNPFYRVGWQVAEALTAHQQLPRAVAARRAVELLDGVGLPDAERIARCHPHSLSGGMRQRVAIAMALANQPDLLIADEPTTALDVTVQAQILEILGRAVTRTSAAMILITHDLGVLAGIADRMLVMYAGRLVEVGTVDDVFSRPRMPYTRGLLEAARAGQAPSPTPRPPGTPVLMAQRVTKHYRLGSSRSRVHAVTDVCLGLASGEALALVGESGCGKSTLARILVHLTTPDAGHVSFDGHDLAGIDHHQLRQLRRRLQIVFQDPLGSLDPRLRVHDLVAEPLLIHRMRRAAADRVAEVLALVGLDLALSDRYPHELSGGERQRVCIARALALKPEVLVLDEPVSALDASIRVGVLDLLADLQDRLGLAMVFISHDLAVVRRVADRVAVMYLGRIVEAGACEDVFRHPSHPYTQALLSAVPVPDPAQERSRTRIVLVGEVPSPVSPPSGCRFRTRCPLAAEVCALETPALVDRGCGHPVACHFPGPGLAVDVYSSWEGDRQ